MAGAKAREAPRVFNVLMFLAPKVEWINFYRARTGSGSHPGPPDCHLHSVSLAGGMSWEPPGPTCLSVTRDPVVTEVFLSQA